MVRRRSTVRFRNGAPGRTYDPKKSGRGSESRWGLTAARRGHTDRPASRSARPGRRPGVSPSAPGPLGNRGKRAPDRPAPVTAHPDMRRCLTGPSPDGHPRTIGAGPGRSAAARRWRATAWPGRGGENAGGGHPCPAHVGVAGVWGSRATGIASSARRWPGVTAAGTGRSSGAGAAIASRPDLARGHRLGHGARTSGGRGRHRARPAWASGPRPGG
jgi:hypothetical protein